ncbi:serine hydrolase domain-containing protein [Nocardiopsis ansamitocini]|uniref:Beta-lactamase-related domain-containing protein n=1 Tax=Nocardiopsis ansamitocini TaxID=1670832 RepID=A0A9W6PA25_9ACTN|nr:serine hydrolase domain-containing protein [Nocardiopsis ansamitocini]GLU49782.1 hypothetical protein Nans01_41330 [Nocardiopsis ansamitocini]
MDTQQRTPAQQPPTAVCAPRAPGRVWGAALLAGAVVGGLAFWTMPTTGPTTFTAEGDPEIAAAVNSAVAGREHVFQGLSAASATDNGVATSTAGTTDGDTPVTGDTPFETGSVFKLFTAMTLADMAEKGEVELDDTVGEIFSDLEFADPAVATVTLEELATHQSGLPSIPAGYGLVSLGHPLVFTDPFAGLPPVTESLAAAAETPQRGEWNYSNFGFATLGAALSEAAGLPFPELVRERVLDPLGMDATGIVGADIPAGGVPEGGAMPHYEAGSRSQVWGVSHYAPAGVGTWSTTGDFVRFAEAVRAGDAPGLSALEPLRDGPVETMRSGLGWQVSELADGTVRHWHDGATYGSGAFLAVEEDRSVVVLANSAPLTVPMVGLAVLEPDAGHSVGDLGAVAPSRALGLALTLPLLVVPVGLALALMAGRKTLVTRRHLDRLRLVSMPLGAFAVVLSSLRWGSWAATPHLLWALAVGLLGTAVVVGAWHWRRVPTVRATWLPVRLGAFVLSTTVSLALIGTIGWAVAVSVG